MQTVPFIETKTVSSRGDLVNTVTSKTVRTNCTRCKGGGRGKYHCAQHDDVKLQGIEDAENSEEIFDFCEIMQTAVQQGRSA